MDKNNNIEGPLLLLGTQMEIGGAQKVLLDQANWFHNKGSKVFALFFYDKQNIEGQWQEKYEFPIINLEAWKLESSSLSNILRVFVRAWKLFKILKQENIEIIETFKK